MRTLLKKIRELTWPSTWYGWRLALQSWWYIRDKKQFAFLGVMFSVILLVPIGIYVLVHQAEASKRTERELACLTRNIYHEARGEPLAGQYAVAEVTLNRVASSRFPDTVCEVVFEQRWDRIRKRHVGAFSWTELETDGRIDQRELKNFRKIAEAVYHKQAEPRVKDALFYHANYIRPSWARTKQRVARIGRHIFYR